jgi:anion-transporting  ArsA/GET3 family ATPase
MATPVPATPFRVFEDLAQRKLLVVSGKGGVGRTTVAALLGMAVARRGRRVLVATTGHDDRLAWMLGAENLGGTPVEVAPGLSIMRLLPPVCIREYGTLVLRSARISKAVFGNRLVRKLLGALPGVDDFAVLGKVWHEAARASNYDTVVFDGPTTGHLRFTLGVPQALVEAIGHGPLTREAELMLRTIEDPAKTSCVLVGLPEHWPLTELGELAAALRNEVHANIGTIVVNAMWPTAVPSLNEIANMREVDREVAAALEHVRRMAAVGQRHRDVIQEWLASEAAGRSGAPSVIEIPWRFEGLQGEVDMAAMLGRLDSRQEAG